jgi:hypothetical protein
VQPSLLAAKAMVILLNVQDEEADLQGAKTRDRDQMLE